MRMLKIFISMVCHISVFFLGWGIMAMLMEKGSNGLVDGNGVFFVVTSISIIVLCAYFRIVIWKCKL